MTRLGAGDFGPAPDEARRAAEQGQLEAQRLSDLDRARILARAAPAALDPANPRGPEELGRILGEVQSMVAEARLGFVAEVARQGLPAGGVGDAADIPPPDPGAFVRQLLDESFPRGSSRRLRLGEVLVASVGANPSGVSPKLLEAMVARAVGSLVPPPLVPAPPRKPLPLPPAREVLERGVLGRFGGRILSSATRGLLDPRPAAARSAPARSKPFLGLTTPTSLARLSLETSSSAHQAPSTPVLVVGRRFGADAAPGLVGRPIAAVASRLQAIQDKVDAVRKALLDARGGLISVRIGLRKASGFMEKAARRLGVARELLARRRDPRETVCSAASIIEELAGLRADVQQAVRSLWVLRGKVDGLPGAVAEVREIERMARGAELQLRMVRGRAALLVEVEGLTAVEGSSGLVTEDDVSRMGTGLDGDRLPAQATWSEEMVDTVCTLGRAQGGITEAEARRNAEVAGTALGSEDTTGPGPAPMGAPDVAAAVKLSAVALERVDPNQLRAVARYVNTAATRAEQQDKLRRALDTLQILGRIGLPKLPREQIVKQLCSLAHVPPDALADLSAAETQRKFQEVVAALNGGETAQIKVGRRSLRLEIGPTGLVVASAYRKPGLLSRVWDAL
jgi:hypothetical protein